MWEYIQEDIDHFFGPLAVVARGQLEHDSLLRDCYVKDFAEHGDEKLALRHLDNLLEEDDINFYSEIQGWVAGKRHIVEGIIGIGHYDEFDPTSWQTPHYPRMLCGMKGCGKTTLHLFTKSTVEEQPGFKYIFVTVATPTFGGSDPLSFVTDQIIQQIDQLTLDLCKENGISEKDMVIRRYESLWRSHNCYPDPEDIFFESRRKKRLRDKLLLRRYESRHGVEFMPYLTDTIKFLKVSLSTNLVIVVDDVDRLPSIEEARAICTRTRTLARELLDTPVMISIREETIAKLSDMNSSATVTRMSIIPPSFLKVIQKRQDIFNEKFRMDNSIAERTGYNTDKVKIIVKHIVESVLTPKTYANLVAYHYDLDILLDVVRCLIKSPFLEPKFVLNLYNQNNLIPWHIILDSIQRFQYKNFYDENSFILNIFNNNENSVTLLNTIIRVRLLQLLRHLGVNELRTDKIYTYMQQLGYNINAVTLALKAFARQRLILTWQQYNSFSPNTVPEILPQKTIIYYLDSLMYSYRYLQNILPVTYINFDIPMDIVEVGAVFMGEKLAELSNLLMKFVEFIRICEEEEEKLVKDKELFKAITREQTLSDVMKGKLEGEICAMKGPLERKSSDGKTRVLVQRIENNPDQLFSMDLFKELKAHVKVNPEEFQNISNTLGRILDEFTKEKLGVPMEEKTKNFLKNELVYLILKAKEKNTWVPIRS